MFRLFVSLLVSFIVFNSSISLVRADLCRDGVTDGCNPRFQDNPAGNTNAINIGYQLTNSKLGIQAPNSQGIVGTILKNVLIIFFSVGGIGTVVYFIWGAVDWILAGGDKEKVSNARKKITQALVGLVLLSLSFVIIRVVGEIVGFNPLAVVQIPSLEDK